MEMKGPPMNPRPLAFGSFVPLLLALLALLAVPACSSSSGPDTHASDAGADIARDAAHPDASSGDASSGDASADTSAGDASSGDAEADAPAACNTLANGAATIPVEQMAADPPAPQGGAVADGTYTLTSAVIYTGPNGPSGATGTTQTTLQITGATIQVVSAGDPPTRTVTFTTSGTSLDYADTCPDTATSTGVYTATPTTFVIELAGGTDDAGARTLVETFTKQ
jgi:hypothetical protein